MEYGDMTQGEALPELKQILGAMIFGANRPLSPKEMRKCLLEVAGSAQGEAAAFGEVTEQDVVNALEELRQTLADAAVGFSLAAVAGGYRLQSDARCGRWLKHLLEVGKPSRLSRPALETLAIVAYKQPVVRSEIEAVRGVGVDHLVKALLEMQLIKIVGRSELPGKPFMYGTTQLFLEHFGLTSLDDLQNMDPALMIESRMVSPDAAAKAGTGGASGGEQGPDSPEAEVSAEGGEAATEPLEPVYEEQESGQEARQQDGESVDAALPPAGPAAGESGGEPEPEEDGEPRSDAPEQQDEEDEHAGSEDDKHDH